jgi:hypothetical protein
VALLGKSSTLGSSAVTPISMEPLQELTYDEGSAQRDSGWASHQ